MEVRLYAEHLDVWYGQKRVERLPRLRGEDKHRIDYRHVIDWLIRKPGAFADYRYRNDLFPTSRFRIVYDLLTEQSPSRGHKEYLKILHLAAQQGERAVNTVLGIMVDGDQGVTLEKVKQLLNEIRDEKQIRDPEIMMVDLRQYDQLVTVTAVAS